MSCSTNALRITLLCYLIRSGFPIVFGSGIVSNVHELLKSFKCPIKLTIVTCWNPEKTVKLVRHFTDYQTKIVNDSTSEITSNPFERQQEVILVDFHCVNAPTIFGKMNRFVFDLCKIVVFDSSIGMHNNSVTDIDTKIRLLFDNCPIMPMSQVFFISEDFIKNTFLVKQAYRKGINEPLVTEEFLISDVKTTMTPVLRRRNLQGLQLRASMVILNSDSLNHLDDYRDKHIDAVSKVSYQLTNDLMAFVNATIKYSIVSTWGYKNQTTGKWTGMVGEILSDEVDIGATPLFFTMDRVSILEYISRPSSARGGFVFRAPKLSYTSNIYLLPFDRLLWMCLGFLVLFIGMCLCGAVIIELNLFKSLENKCRINDVYMIVYGALCQQGSYITPNSVTSRIIMAIAFIILMFLYVSYSANIVALLQSPSNQIKTLQDLYESKIDTEVENTVYNRHYFPLITETLRRKFYEEKLMNKDGKFKLGTLEEGIRKVRQGQFAFYTEYSSAYKIISETFLDIEKCGLQELSFFEIKLEPFYAIQKNSSYKEILKIGMMRINEHGIQQRENLRYYTTKPKCLGGGGNFVSASLIDTYPAILLLVWGTAIALVVFICEQIVARFRFVRKKVLALLMKFRLIEHGHY